MRWKTAGFELRYDWALEFHLFSNLEQNLSGKPLAFDEDAGRALMNIFNFPEFTYLLKKKSLFRGNIIDRIGALNRRDCAGLLTG